ncbi:MAG: ABC transporter ATP-binding protein [Solirubrobacteraceae bacterium]
MPEAQTSRFRLDEVLAPVGDRRARELPSLIRAASKLVWKAAPRQTLQTSVLQLVMSVGFAAQLLVSRGLLTHLLAGQAHGYGSTIPYVAALAVTIAIVGMASSARGEIQRLLSELVGRYAMGRVIEASNSMELLAFEVPEFHDRQQRALVSAASRPTQMTAGLAGLGGGLLSAAGISVALLVVQPLFLGLILVAFVPAWLATVAAGRAMYVYAVEQTETDRRRFYLQMVLTNKDTAKEVRAYDTGAFLRGRYDQLYETRIQALRRVVRRRTRQGLGGGALTGVLTGAVLGAIVWFLSDGRLTLAGAGVAAGGVILLGSQLQAIAAAAGSLYESSLFVRDFTSFVDGPRGGSPTAGTGSPPERFELITAQDIRFTYPSRTEPSLEDVSIELRAGQVVALVGENGSGKTTLAKVLAGLYRPDAGVVSWDGLDVAAMAPAAMRAKVAVLFQDFIRYQLSATENIGFGEPGRLKDDEAIAAAARSAGAHEFLAELPNGYATTLGPEFIGGVDLSGGQWQRIALARAFLRRASLIILDEPTASLDPRAEAELFVQVRKLFRGRTVLLISHRFASVRLADHIYVLDQGRVIEHGSHDGLMDHQGTYATLFTLQASAYGVGGTAPPGVDFPR